VPPTLFIPEEALLPATIAPERWRINASDPAALTRRLDVPACAVTAVEYGAHLDGLVVRGAHIRDLAACPACGTRSAQAQQYQPRTVRDRSLAGHARRLEFTARRCTCAPCRRPCTEPLAAVAPPARCTRRHAPCLFAP